LKVYTDIAKVKAEWDKFNVSDFIHSSFLEAFYINHPNIKHLFVISKDIRLYANIFKLSFSKTISYLRNKRLGVFVKFLNLDVLYLTNSFITNIPAFVVKNKINLDKFLSVLQCKYTLLVIPDFVFNNITTEKNQFSKVEVEGDMVLEIHDNWCNLDSYVSDFRKKYRKQIKKFLNSGREIEIRPMNTNDLVIYSDNIKALFLQVINESKFSGPLFNTESFLSLIKKDIFKVYGYFLNNELIAFSSEIHQDKILYSYYVGFDKSLNKTFSIYPRILLESINNAIALKMDKVVFGRTANEFKSNFGAKPIKSYVYIKVKNRFLSIILKPILKRLTIKKWVKRSPLKNIQKTINKPT
tara:strand:- start:1892 stop:2956 length:1065 start_codon:yes stop_codon:yes gene_type:complete